jgi:orotidine-5'-phosphate decarboxylase
MTLHVQQKAALEAAVKAAEGYKATLLGVTVLTSMSPEDLVDLRMTESLDYADHHNMAVSMRVTAMAAFGYGCELRGFVCSPLEVKSLHELYPDATLLVPGIRPAGADTGDQKRTGTPRQAMEDGATFLVVGRPIRDTVDPVAAAKAIVAEIPA